MTDKLNPNIRSIVHILNNWNFTFDGSYVRANLEIHITKDELEQVKTELKKELDSRLSTAGMIVTDEEKNSYNEAIADLEFSINELNKSII
jgi:hypothetical protein